MQISELQRYVALQAIIYLTVNCGIDVANAATYFVDNTVPSCAQNGNLTPCCSDTHTTAQNSQARPWCTINKANNTHVAGDTVLIKGEHRASIFPKTGISNSQRTIYSGATTNPDDAKILGSDLVANWSIYSGNISVAPFTAPQRCGLNSTSCWEDRNSWYTRVNSLVEVNSPGKFYYSGTQIYAWPFAGTTVGHTIECSVRSTASLSDLDNYTQLTGYFTLQNLTIMHSHDRGLTLDGQMHDSTIQNNVFQYNTGCGTGSGNPAAIMKHNDEPLPTGLVIRNNHIHHQGDDRGFVVDQNVGVTHRGTGLLLYSIKDAIIENNQIHDVPEGMFIKFGPSTIPYENVNIKNNVIYNTVHGINFGGGGTSSSFSALVEGNLIYNSQLAAFNTHRNNNVVTLRHNTFYNTAGLGVHVDNDSVSNSPGNNRITFENNIIANTPRAYYGFFFDSSPISTVDYNMFFQRGAHFGTTDTDCPGPCDEEPIPPPGNPNVNHANLQVWQIQTGHDVHSQEVDPQFNNVAALDFRPRQGSPACTAGDTGGYVGAFPCVGSDASAPAAPSGLVVQ